MPTYIVITKNGQTPERGRWFLVDEEDEKKVLEAADLEIEEVEGD